MVPARRKPRRQNDKNLRRAAEHKQKIQTEKIEGNSDVIVTASKDDEIRDTVDVFVNVITNESIIVWTDTMGVEKLSKCVGECTMNELNEYATEAEYEPGSIKFCGKLNDKEWEYQLKYRVNLREDVTERKIKSLLEECRGMGSAMCRATEAIDDTDLRSLRLCNYVF